MSAPNSQAAAVIVDQLFSAAFSASRDPRSGEYMDNTRAALAYRSEGARIGQPYPVGTAAANAFASGIAEGHAIWCGASGQSVTTDGAYVGGFRVIGQLAADIEAQAGDIEILLAALFDKLDELTDLVPAAADAMPPSTASPPVRCAMPPLSVRTKPTSPPWSRKAVQHERP